FRSCASGSTMPRSRPSCRTRSDLVAPTPRSYSSAISGEETFMQNLMQGRRGLVMGVANDHSIAWGIAEKLAAAGAELAFTYQGEAFGRRVRPLAERCGASLVIPCDVEDEQSVASLFETITREWGRLDFLVHAIG